MVPHRFNHAPLAILVLLSCLVQDAMAGDKSAYRPAYLIEDTKQGIAFWSPEGFLPNPDEALKRNARSFWYGSTQAFDKWGYFTFFRTGPVAGLDPSYWIEILEKQWGPTAEQPTRIKLPETEALLFLFLPEEKNSEAWAIYTLLIPAARGVYDFTVYAPKKQRARLRKFLLAFGRCIHSYHPKDRRTFTLPCGVSLHLLRTWVPTFQVPAGRIFRITTMNARFHVDFTLVPGTLDAAAYFKDAFSVQPATPLALRTEKVPVGQATLAADPSTKGTFRAIATVGGDTLILEAVLSGSRGEAQLLDICKSLEFTPVKALVRSLKAERARIRQRSQSSRAMLREALSALTRFAGFPGAARGFEPVLAGGREEAVIEAALAIREMAPFGPDTATLVKSLERARAKKWHRAATALILTLGRVRASDAVEVIQPVLFSKTPGLAHAAVNALGFMPFGRGEAMDALIKVYAHLGQSGRGTRVSSSRGGLGGNRFKLLYYPILTALRRQSGRDFPYPDGVGEARKWLDSHLKQAR